MTRERTMVPCLCANRGYVRALEEDDFGFPDKVDTLAELIRLNLPTVIPPPRSFSFVWNNEQPIGQLLSPLAPQPRICYR